MKRVERIHVISRADALQSLRHLLREIVSDYTYSLGSLENIILAINEACMNVIQHAYHGFDNGEIIVELWKMKNGLKIKIIDYANKSDLNSIKSRDLGDVRPGGIGVHIIKQLMDEVVYKNFETNTGNVLEMTKWFDEVSNNTNDVKIKGGI